MTKMISGKQLKAIQHYRLSFSRSISSSNINRFTTINHFQNPGHAPTSKLEGGSILLKASRPFLFSRRAASWSTRSSGTANSLDYRLHFLANGKQISPWHEIPLNAEVEEMEGLQVSNLYNYINEIPKGSRAKMEVATTEKNNPIKQDVKKGKLRFFTYGDIPFNYGCLPQTWENPHYKDTITNCVGDNDPIDVVEISPTPLPTGVVVRIKVLGIIGLIDEQETDWKVIGIANANPLTQLLHDVNDIEHHMPGTISRIQNWFRYYKTSDGKPENTFAFNGKALDQTEALRIISETHRSWQELGQGRLPAGDLYIVNSTTPNPR